MANVGENRLWVMSAIMGLMYGTQYFQASDLPFYSRGLDIMIAVAVAGLALVGVQIGLYTLYDSRTRRLREQGQNVEGRYRYVR